MDYNEKAEEQAEARANLNYACDALKQIKKNLINIEVGEYSYDRAFNNILELADVALDHITEVL